MEGIGVKSRRGGCVFSAIIFRIYCTALVPYLQRVNENSTSISNFFYIPEITHVIFVKNCQFPFPSIISIVIHHWQF